MPKKLKLTEDRVDCLHCGDVQDVSVIEDKLYGAIEAAIIRWRIDNTRTAGSLTREIMLIIKQQDNG